MSPLARAVMGTCMHSRAAAPAIPIAPIIIVEPALEEGERVVPAWQSVAIRGHQRSSEAIRGHQEGGRVVPAWQSVAISGNQRSSEVISGHQRSSVAIRGHQWSSVVIRGHQRSSVVITPQRQRRHSRDVECTGAPRARPRAPAKLGIQQGHARAIRRNRSPSGALRRTQSHSVAIRRHQAQSVAISRHQSQSVAIRRNQTQSDAIRRNHAQLGSICGAPRIPVG